mgnify:CR=1 FL=1
MSPLLTVNEVAKLLRVSKAHVHHLISGRVKGARALPAVRLGRRTLVRESVLSSWLADTETGSVVGGCLSLPPKGDET